MALEKLTSSDFTGKGVTGLADIPNLSASEMQAKFDELPREVLAPKLNETIEQANTTQTALTTHTADMANPHSVTKMQLGLGNVENTADMDKPVSEAQAEAILSAASQLSALLMQHESNTLNPHGVTAEQAGAATEAFVWNAIATVTGEGSGTPMHGALSGRNAADQHPISAITGLQSALQATQTHAASSTNPHSVTLTQAAAAGGVLPVSSGGTGAATAAGALSALGVEAYVCEKGVNNGWTYKKFSDRTYEAVYLDLDWSNFSVSTARGSVFTSAPFSFPLPAFSTNLTGYSSGSSMNIQYSGSFIWREGSVLSIMFWSPVETSGSARLVMKIEGTW